MDSECSAIKPFFSLSLKKQEGPVVKARVAILRLETHTRARHAHAHGHHTGMGTDTLKTEASGRRARHASARERIGPKAGDTQRPEINHAGLTVVCIDCRSWAFFCPEMAINCRRLYGKRENGTKTGHRASQKKNWEE